MNIDNLGGHVSSPRSRSERTKIRGLGATARAHGLEAAGFALVIAIAVALRVVRLGTIPRIIAGDEAETLQDALRINAGTGPSIFGFDWGQSPILATYPLAWILRIFGDSVGDIRLYPVIFSVLTLILVYFLAREVMSAPAALAAVLLLATNVWFLNFSRTLWYNMNAPFFAVGACWTITRALKTTGRTSWIWWLATALFVTGGLYGYATGRFICISIAVIALFAVIARLAPRRKTLLGLGLVVVVSAVLFAPEAKFLHDHYDRFTTRSNTVSVFHAKNPDGTKKNGWLLAWRNIEPNVRGLIFNEPLEGQRGPYNARYHPVQNTNGITARVALTLFATILFLSGLLIAARRWRETYTWFPFFIPVFIVNLFSGDTPDYSRSILLAPFYFLFIGLVFNEALRQRWRFAPRPLVLAAILTATVYISVRDVKLYFEWQGNATTQAQRMPGIDYCEYNDWLARLKEAAQAGRIYSLQAFNPIRRELHCSPVVDRAGGYD